MRSVTQAWIWLTGLSLGTTALSLLAGRGEVWICLLFLVFSGWKARIILVDYLELSKTRVWRRGFNALVIVFLIGAAGLYLLPLSL
jgi:hypothetical protein